jgi:Uma2 family endonuclease
MGYALMVSDYKVIARMTVEEYFAFEAKAAERHMYLDGHVLAMGGGTGEQSAIISNIQCHAGNALEGMPCRPYETNLRIRYGKRAQYGYSDGIIVCGEPAYDERDGKNLTLLNPTVVFEVMSDSSALFDRSEKFELYQEIQSFREYVLVDQNRPRVEVLLRNDDGSWKFTPFSGIDAVVKLDSVGISLTMKQIYADVKFPPPQEPIITPTVLEQK